MTRMSLSLLLAALVAAGGVAGCVQMPTERQGAVDLRPSVGFDVSDPQLNAQGQLVVDGLAVGALSSYSNGAGMLKLLPGNHLVQVQVAHRTVFEQRVYLGDGARRQIAVSAGSTP